MNNNKKVIDYFSLGHPLTNLRSHYANRARKTMFELFMSTMSPTADALILDLGVTPDQTLSESNFFEKMYPYKNRIVAASIEDASFLEDIYPGLQFVRTEPGESLPFEDNQFDVLFCSAVIEHVGSRKSQQQFIEECIRVSKKFFFTTPNRQFPLDFHTFLPLLHWLPQSVHQTILRWLGLDFWSKTENLNLLTPKELKKLFPSNVSVNIYNYKLFGLPSNIVIYGEKSE